MRFPSYSLEISLRGKNGKRRTSFSLGNYDNLLIEACGWGVLLDNFILKTVPWEDAKPFATLISVEVDVKALQNPFY